MDYSELEDRIQRTEDEISAVGFNTANKTLLVELLINQLVIMKGLISVHQDLKKKEKPREQGTEPNRS